MASHEELPQATTPEFQEIDVDSVRALLAGERSPALVDVRRSNEWEAGRIRGALHVPLQEIEAQIEEAVPDRARAVILYCARGNRSVLAARKLAQVGYRDVASMAGGIEDWREKGFSLELPAGLDKAQFSRYSRHLLIPEVAAAGQRRLLDARILLIGAGGLGSPAALYLAAAGAGRLGIVDDDIVDASNLQRQVLHSTAALKQPKTESAARRIRELNPDVEVKPYSERLSADNVDRILAEGWDVVVDGADNFPTRYLLNDASVWHHLPVVHGSIFRFDGQVTVFAPGRGPCYRCLFPTAAATRARQTSR